MGFGSIGMPELLIILLVVLLLFGAKRLPELAKGLGKGIREFKDATKHVEEEFKELEKDDQDSK
ncbi:Sec-independent protein translocase TatA [bacterium I07]|nr:Sec-independent protein translocase TatA [bacterium I07]